MRRVLPLVAVALLLAACGGGSHHATTTKQPCPQAARALAKIARDQGALNRATTADEMSTLTDRFLLDLVRAPISNLQRNRLIDHAAAAVAVKCPQCFQALEAERPIPAIRQGDVACKPNS